MGHDLCGETHANVLWLQKVSEKDESMNSLDYETMTSDRRRGKNENDDRQKNEENLLI